MDANYRAVTLFREAFGHEPQGLWSAPGRANLIGEHTDYNEGLVLPFAIDARTYVALSPRTDGVFNVVSEQQPREVVAWSPSEGPPSKRGWASYPLGVAWLLGGGEFGGADMAISSDVPVGAGLSSSAALECSVATALAEIWELPHSPVELAGIGTRAENEVVGAPTGTMDQLASMLGREDCGVRIDCRDLSTRLVPLRVRAEGLEFIIIDSQQKHDHAEGGYSERRAQCERAAELLSVSSLREIGLHRLGDAEVRLPESLRSIVRHVVTENDRVLQIEVALQNADFSRVGDLISESHASLRDDFQVSTEYIDQIVQACLDSGSLGARLIGGGFGGAVLALVPADIVERVAASVATLRPPHNLQPASMTAVVPSAGAKRDRCPRNIKRIGA